MRCNPLLRHVLEAVVLGRILALARVKDILDHALGLGVLAVVSEPIGEVDLAAPVVGMSGQRALEDLDRLAHVTLGPRQLEEIAPPDDLRRAVEVVLVDLERGLQAVAELPFDALRERGEDADALRVEADADARLVMTADVVRL